MKLQVEESKKTKECLNKLIKHKTEVCARLEHEVVTLRIEDKFKESTKKIDEMMAMKKYPNEKGGLGFEAGEFSNQRIEDKGNNMKI